MLVKTDFYHFNGSKLAHIKLCRESKANALNSEMIHQFQECVESIQKQDGVRLVVLTAQGKHFSAGADLGWMKDSATMSFEENIADARTLHNLIQSIATLPQMTIALAHGAAYGGALGFLAACDYVLSDTDTKFCLSEVKLGLLPAIIYPFLMNKMHPAALKKLALTAQVFNAEEALKYGLVDDVCNTSNKSQFLFETFQHLLKTAPESVQDLKDLHQLVQDHKSPDTASFIAVARTREEGQHGLHSFFEKSTPKWVYNLEPQDSEWQRFIANL